jgi:hypothetical protein
VADALLPKRLAQRTRIGIVGQKHNGLHGDLFMSRRKKPAVEAAG